MKKILIALAIVSSSILSVYAFIGMERVWEFTSGNPDLGPVNFKTLKKTREPNQYLLCPVDYCSETPDSISNSYDFTADKLFAEILFLIEEDSEFELLASDKIKRSIRALSRSSILKFPDTTSIQILKISNTQSALSIYARAQIGSSDLGVNKTRTDAMIKKLERRIASSN